MRALFVLALSLLSTNVFAAFDKSNCPDTIVFSFTYAKQSPLTPKIENDPELKRAWDSVGLIPHMDRVFPLQNYGQYPFCFYVIGKAVAFLQENAKGEVEFLAPYNNANYFKVKVLSFNRDDIQIADTTESRMILSPVKKRNRDGKWEIVDEVQTGTVETLDLLVR